MHIIYLHRDFFHSIRFKVNKVRGQGVVPFFVLLLMEYLYFFIVSLQTNWINNVKSNI